MGSGQSSSGVAAVFFDLGDTLGTATVGGRPPRLIGFDLFPFVLPSPTGRGVLAEMRDNGLRVGVISNTGDEVGAAVNAVLRPTGLLAYVDPALLVYSGDEGVTKASPEIFKRAAARAGLAAAACMFVGEDKVERAAALGAGWAVCPHPLLVGEVLDGQPLQYVRLSVPAAHAQAPWRPELQRRAFVPQHLTGPRGTNVYGLTSERVAHELMHMRFGIELLGDPGLPLTTDLYLLQDDVARTSGFLSSRGEAASIFGAAGRQRLLLAAPSEGVVAALPPDVGPDDVHFASARHGHTLKLTPDPLLWDVPPPTAAPAGFAPGVAALPPAAVEAFTRIGAAAILESVERYSGARPLDGSQHGQRLASRHILAQAGGNRMAVDQLVADLESAGQGLLQVRLHPFTLSGQTFHNVEAELAGDSSELVLVSAHLDSTAGFDDGYDPATSAAPGADDDASGVAAVLAIAKQMAALAAAAGPPGRTVRFVLFNAEEEGLVGSKAYARRSKTRGEAIAAVWQMDMIGHNVRPPADWEVHAGAEASPAVEARSRRLAELMLAVAPLVAPSLPAPKIHHSTSPGGDPAAGRSDHASFHAHGYPACAVSEDFFVDSPEAPQPDANPHYHRSADREIDPEYAAALARAVAAAAWVTAASATPEVNPPFTTRLYEENAMPASREFDSRKSPAATAAAPAAVFARAPTVSATRRNSLTGSPVVVAATETKLGGMPYVERALAFVQGSATAGFAGGAGQRAEFVADPTVQRTSAGGAAVHLTQTYRGLTVFQMSRTVRFDSAGRTVDAVGDTAAIPDGISTDPKLSAEAAVLKAAQHLASSGREQTIHDAFGQTQPVPTIDLGDFKPTVVSGFPLPAKATVFDRGPFENLIPAYLLIFNEPERARLAWHMVFTFPGYADQYVAIVAADDAVGELLYCKGTLHRALARGRVYEFSPGVADRRLIDFPRPIGDYPAMPTSPLAGFPAHWIDSDQTLGNSTRATLNTATQAFKGVVNNGVVEFEPAKADGDEQKLLNIFYFCNYMHDFLYVLGFDEASGNFQQVNFTNTGAGGDPVRARAHSGPVFGTANMATAPDGLPPLMNMGLVSGNRHTAYDADVVFHEYVHGLTNRLVGGRMNTNALDKLQSGGKGEGWSDYFALTVQNFFSTNEKVVSGDWVVSRPAGIRRAPYDDNYPFKYGDLAASPEVHDIGEVWCATLMMMTRKLVVALSDKQQGYRLAWTIVVDGLKTTPANPTFLDARDAILMALDDLANANRIPPATVQVSRRAVWEAFAHFGMGVNASSGDADDVDGIVADNTLPPGV